MTKGVQVQDLGADVAVQSSEVQMAGVQGGAHRPQRITVSQGKAELGIGLTGLDIFVAVGLDPRGDAQQDRPDGARHLNLTGLHCHIGSQILDLDTFRHTASVMVDFLRSLRRDLAWTASELDLGGGLGVYYTAGDEPPAISSYAAAVRGSVEESCRRYGYPRPRSWWSPAARSFPRPVRLSIPLEQSRIFRASASTWQWTEG